MPFMNPRDVVTYVPSDLLYGVPPTEDNVRNILATLDLQETLILSARLNAIISGIGTVAIEDRIHHVPLRGHPERGKALFGAFGDAFEEYSNGILQRMFAHPHFGLEKMDGKTTVFEVDALVAEGPSAFVFETKAKFLNEDLVSGNAYAGFVEHLREKYVSRGNAVWQLAKITAATSAGNWTTMPAELEAATRIFPIVLTHDIRMDSPGTGMFLDQEMKRGSVNPPRASGCAGRIAEGGLRYADAWYADAWLSGNSEKPIFIVEVQQIRHPGRPA
jgi:hypothetical protein